ncbi:MAG: hypothetical protein ACRDKW_11040 [Actinomycetota bacterium]
MTRARIIVAALLGAALILGAAYVAWGDRDHRLAGLNGREQDRAEFAAALQGRFDELTPAERRETCTAVKVEGLGDAIVYIRERHYGQPGGPRMPFFDDLAAEILERECLTVVA